MKKSLQITGLISIALLYCIAIGLYSGVAFNGNAAFAKQSNTANDSYTAAVSAKSFHHTVQTENSVTVVNNTRPLSLKNSYSEYSACIKVSEQLFIHTFTQYSFYSYKLLVSLQKTNLIFPFHYFW